MGYKHLLALSDNGRLFFYGTDLIGQEKSKVTKEIVLPNESKVKKIACSGFLNVAVNEKGDLYFWGKTSEESKLVLNPTYLQYSKDGFYS